ncbi:MAG: hypothetical protein JWM50_646 [Microbacteriaceae bacterium]|jgi:hypothetical protein|nr:hypothetical protein [Microbacteriaceae bacterium]
MNIRKMLTVAIAVGTLAFGTSAVAPSSPASAHTPEASATCSTLTVSLKSYGLGPNSSYANNITVTIDSSVVQDTRFGTSFKKAYPLGDSTVAHSYVVRIDAIGNQYDRTFTGTSTPCAPPVVPAVPDASATLSVTPATCDTSGTLALGEIKHATWGTPTAVTGPAQYSVVATAAPKHTFADGKTTKTFTGSLEGKLAAGVEPCIPPVVVPARPAAVQTVTHETVVDCAASTQTTTTTTTTTDWTLDTATNTWVTAPAIVTTSTATVPATVTVCPTSGEENPPTSPGTTTPETTTPGDTTPGTTTPADTTPGTTTPADTTPVVATPSVPAAVTARAVPTADVLAFTGSNAGAIAPIGAGIFLAGLALMIARRFAVKRGTTTN